MTKTLLILRHAKSSWKNEKLKDFDRPLKRRGEEDAIVIGKVLVRAELVPQVILSSPAERAKQTAELVAAEAKFKGGLAFVDSFYMGEPENYIKALNELPDEIERVMVVGHNPGLEALLQLLDGKVDSLPTGSLAYLVLGIKHWADLTKATVGELISFWEPDEINLEEMEVKMGKDKDKKDKKDKKEKKEKKDKKKDKK
ncbi:MAG TPA: histidine phosphatase family protein [Anaerolineaceae bacterium]|nr:histidine phosphatase family protein [Anaerolineaceae bacterium]